MNRIDLSTKYVSLHEASTLLTRKIKAPRGMMMEVGEYQGRFYLLDGVTSRISRLTLGAFLHLREAWKADTSFVEQAE